MATFSHGRENIFLKSPLIENIHLNSWPCSWPNDPQNISFLKFHNTLTYILERAQRVHKSFFRNRDRIVTLVGIFFKVGGNYCFYHQALVMLKCWPWLSKEHLRLLQMKWNGKVLVDRRMRVSMGCSKIHTGDAMIMKPSET